MLRLPRIAKKSSPGHGPRVLVTRSAAGPHGLRVTSLNVCLRQLNAQKRSCRAHWPPQPGALAPGSRANGAQFTGHGARYVLGGTLSPGHGPAVTAYAANVTKYFKAQPARLCRFFVTWAKPVFFWHDLCVRQKKPGCCRVDFSCAAGALIIASCARPYHVRIVHYKIMACSRGV